MPLVRWVVEFSTAVKLSIRSLEQRSEGCESGQKNLSQHLSPLQQQGQQTSTVHVSWRSTLSAQFQGLAQIFLLTQFQFSSECDTPTAPRAKTT